ncbi:MAG: hypothetical protein R3E88_04560 [Myxococcota bacterium]|nr:hypothetical protein [Myxococcales bacterium]
MQPATHTPALKGLAVRPAFDRVCEMRKRGAIDDGELASRLGPRHVGLVDSGVEAGLWYPIELQDRLLRIVSEVDGGGDDHYLVAFGRETARAVTHSAAMQWLIEGARALGPRAGRALVRMARVGFNFGTYTFEGDTMDQFVVRCTEVDPMPTSIGLNIQGFIEQVASDWRRRNLACVFERPHRGEILFRVKPRL